MQLIRVKYNNIKPYFLLITSFLLTKTERSIQAVLQDKECCSSEESGVESVEEQLFPNLYDKPSKRQAHEDCVKNF